MPKFVSLMLFSFILSISFVVGGEAHAAGPQASNASQWEATTIGTTLVLRRVRQPSTPVAKNGAAKPAVLENTGRGEELKRGKIKGYSSTADFVRFALGPAN